MTLAPALSGRRLSLRPIESADGAEIAALHADPRVAALLVDGIPDTPEKAAILVRWNRRLAAQGIGTFAVRRHGDARLIGLFSLTPYDADPALLELGGKLAPAAWIGGLALEAASVLIAYAFDALGRDRLVSAFDPGNAAARFALSRLGFRDAGMDRLFGREVSRMVLRRDGWRGIRPLRARRLVEATMGSAPRPAHIDSATPALAG